MTITEPAIILGAGTAVLVILFGARVAMRAGGAGAPRTGGEASTTGGSGAPDVAGVIALPPLIFLAFLVAATVLEAVVPLPLLAGHALARYLAGAALAVCGLVLIAMGTSRFVCRPPHWSAVGDHAGGAPAVANQCGGMPGRPILSPALRRPGGFSTSPMLERIPII